MLTKSSHKILVVDDNAQNRQLVQAILEADNLTVATSEDGKSAVADFLAFEPDLVLLDIMMPGMNGYEVCRRLRSLPGGGDIGIVFLTALDDYGSYQQAIEAGGNDFLTKPINADELLMRTRSLLWINELRDEIDRGVHLLRQQRNSTLSLQRTKDEMTSYLVHDIKNMLASLLSNAEFLQRQLGDQPMLEEAAADIKEVGYSLKKLTDGLLEIGRGEDGTLVVKRGRVELSAVLSGLCDSFERYANGSSDESEPLIVRDFPDSLPVDIDEDLFVRAVENLLDNAHKYSPEDSKITLGARIKDARLLIEVRDEGPGIAPDYRENVFKKHYRIKDGKDGTGLGLAFCRMVALKHEGTIWIEGNEPTGCTVCMEVPA